MPAELARCLREGLHNEIGFAAEEISGVCEQVGERPRSTYEDAFAALDSARALLDGVGYETPEPPGAFVLAPAEHRWMLLKTLRGQRRSVLDLLDDLTPADQSAAERRIAALERLIAAAGWES